MNPYLIQGPAQISFSGGRSSAYMLCKIVEAHQGTLPDDVIVSFANTGKEREETLIFVDRVERYLGIKVNWIEFIRGPVKWKKVDFSTASRKGEPFEDMIAARGYLPNPIARLCTQWLKIVPMDSFRKSIGLGDATIVTGLRADEPRRVAKLKARTDVHFVAPLVTARVGRAEVLSFWASMPFDLELPPDRSNCDLCFLKGTQHLLGVIRQEPCRADWWIAQEADGKLFRIDRPNYATLKLMAQQPQLFDEFEDALPCECTD